MVLDAASGSHADTRNKAVRLIANKLFGQPQLQASIETFARQMLLKLTTMAPAPAATVDPAGAAVVADTAAVGAAVVADAAAAVPEAKPVDARQQPQQQMQHQSAADGARFSGLYCALCTKKQTLLRGLLTVYGQAAEGSRAAIEAVAAGVVPWPCTYPRLL